MGGGLPGTGSGRSGVIGSYGRTSERGNGEGEARERGRCSGVPGSGRSGDGSVDRRGDGERRRFRDQASSRGEPGRSGGDGGARGASSGSAGREGGEMGKLPALCGSAA